MCSQITAGISFGQVSRRVPVSGGAVCAAWQPVPDRLLCALPPGTAGTTSSWRPARREPVCRAGCPPAAASSWPMVRIYIWGKHPRGEWVSLGAGSGLEAARSC